MALLKSFEETVTEIGEKHGVEYSITKAIIDAFFKSIATWLNSAPTLQSMKAELKPFPEVVKEIAEMFRIEYEITESIIKAFLHELDVDLISPAWLV